MLKTRVISADSINNAILEVYDYVLSTGKEVNRRIPVLESSPILIELKDVRKRCCLLRGRKWNPFSAIAEFLWVIAGRNDLSFLSKYLKRAPEFSDDGLTWRAGYGSRLRRYNGNIDQLMGILNLLKKDIMTRRAVIVLWNPCEDYISGSKDYPCNDLLHFLVDCRKRINLFVYVRSNDILWGLSHINLFEWSMLLELVWKYLVEEGINIEIGQLFYYTVCPHLYRDYLGKVKDIVELNGLNSEYPPTVEFDFDVHRFLDNMCGNRSILNCLDNPEHFVPEEDSHWLNLFKLVLSSYEDVKRDVADKEYFKDLPIPPDVKQSIMIYLEDRHG